MQHLEIEFKTGLSQQEFQSLLTYFEQAPAVEQTNYYIDSSDFVLRQNRLALRIRTFKDGGELTLKIPQEVGSLEHNQALTKQECQTLLSSFSLPPGKIADLLVARGVHIQELEILGHLTTLRREQLTSIGLMALDQNTYFGITDYELELEVTEVQEGQKNFLAFLEERKIGYKKLKSKIARFSQNLANSWKFPFFLVEWYIVKQVNEAGNSY